MGRGALEFRNNQVRNFHLESFIKHSQAHCYAEYGHCGILRNDSAKTLFETLNQMNK